MDSVFRVANFLYCGIVGGLNPVFFSFCPCSFFILFTRILFICGLDRFCDQDLASGAKWLQHYCTKRPRYLLEGEQFSQYASSASKKHLPMTPKTVWYLCSICLWFSSLQLRHAHPAHYYNLLRTVHNTFPGTVKGTVNVGHLILLHNGETPYLTRKTTQELHEFQIKIFPTPHNAPHISQ